jgi:hypothetical protein
VLLRDALHATSSGNEGSRRCNSTVPPRRGESVAFGGFGAKLPRDLRDGAVSCWMTHFRRQPIYQRSVARWRNYETALAPLFAKL